MITSDKNFNLETNRLLLVPISMKHFESRSQIASDIWNRVLEKHNDISFRITKEKAKTKSEGLTQKEFNDRMNNPDLYQIEDPHTNRSHKFELKETLE